jgi:regulator of sirC expression with transglutaminase-like and TPR domain
MSLMDLDDSLSQLADDPAASCDLAEVALRLALDEYPELDIEAHLSELDGMAHEVKSYLRGTLAARVTGLCRYLFHEMGFRGNLEEYYDPRNSYLNQVLDRKTGIPITLSALVMAVGERAGMRVLGVGLPGHFVVKAVKGDEEIVFDPFHGGRVLNLEQCGSLVERVTRSPFLATPETLEALPTGFIVQRMLNNLKGVYLRGSDFERAARVIGRLLQLTPDDPFQKRDLGIALLHGGKIGRAIDHLKDYLSSSPEADDAKAIHDMLRAASAEVARWN